MKNGMKIGVRAHDYGTDTPHNLFGRIREHGFESVQLAIKKAIAGIRGMEDITPGVIDEIADALRVNNLSVAVLGAYIEPSVAEEERRKQEVEEFIASLSVAKALGAGCVGTETTNLANHSLTRAEAYKNLCQSLEEILPEAERLGVITAIEPVHYHTINTPELAAQLLREMASPNLALILDPVNLFAPEHYESQYELWDRAFAFFGEHIQAVHLKGFALGEDGRPFSPPLWESMVDNAYLLERLSVLKLPVSVLREEAMPPLAKKDIEYLKNLML